MNSLHSRIAAQLPSIGLTISMLDPTFIEMAKFAGYHFCRIDCEHTLFDENTLTNMLRCARLLNFPCHIRLESLSCVTPLLSLEASGIVVPDVSSAENAYQAVRLLKYAPLGQRAMDGGTRNIRYGGYTRKSYMEQANDNLDLIVQIESREGIEHIDEILSVEGIDMVASGRSDLSQALGFPGQRDHPDVLDAERYIIERAKVHNKRLMLGADSPERVKELYNMGAMCFIVGRDENLAFSALQKHANRFLEE